MRRLIVLVVIAVVTFAARAGAEDQRGVNVSLTPSWQSGPGVTALFNADRVDLHGSEIRIGFVRGLDIEGDWGFSFINTSFAPNSTVDADVAPCSSHGTCGTFLRTVDKLHMTGFEFHQYQPLKTWRERVQLGMIGAVGLGWMHGQIEKHTLSDSSDLVVTTDAGEIFPPSKSVMPLVRIEIAAAGIIVPGFKVRASGGFGMPGYHTFNISFIYLIASR